MIRLLVKPLLILFIVVAVVWSVFFFIERQNITVFKIPIAIEDLDQTTESKQWISAIEQSDYIQLQQVESGLLDADELVKNNGVAVAIVIPEGYAEDLKQLRLKKTIELYRANGLVAMIATEAVSRALYEQQIPFVIKKYVKKDQYEIQKVYKKNQPHNKLTKDVLNRKIIRPDYAISVLIVITFFLLISQIFLFSKIRQFSVLKRLDIYRFAKLRLVSIYLLSIVAVVLFAAFLSSLLFERTFSISYLAIWLLAYQIVASVIFFFIKTTSHTIFMLVLWAACCSAFYIGSQFVGGIL